jgi:peptidyl-prolyl cis-trans isomerase D
MRIIQVVLALVLLPFAFFGVDSYFRGGELGAEVARVGDYKITQLEFQQAVRERQEAMRRLVNNTPLDQALLDSPEMRFAAIEQIVRDRLMLSQALRSGLIVTDEHLREIITSQESFREGGKFSYERYEGFLRSQNLNSRGFEARLRGELLQQPIVDALGESGIIANAVADRIVRLSEQTRDISLATISPASFVAQVTIEDGAVKSYYDNRQREFELPEQVRLEYVVLSLDNLAAQTEVPADEVRPYEQSSSLCRPRKRRRAIS